MISKTTEFLIILLVVSFTACSADVNSKSLIDQPRAQSSLIPQVTSTPYVRDGRLINEKGWPIPRPDQMEQIRVRYTTGSTGDGKLLTITITDYAPIKEYFYPSEIDPYPSLRDYAVGGQLVLKSISELRSNKNIFGYSILAAETEEDKATGMLQRKGHAFVYRVYDGDGDGKYEIMILDSSPFQIPDWTLKQGIEPPQ